MKANMPEPVRVRDRKDEWRKMSKLFACLRIGIGVVPLAKAATKLAFRGFVRVLEQGFQRGLSLNKPVSNEVLEYIDTCVTLLAPATRQIVHLHPQILNVTFRSYLARSFVKDERQTALKHHYAYIGLRMRSDFFRLIYRGGVELLQRNGNYQSYQIHLKFDRNYHAEGDLTLALSEGETQVYCASFSIVPGWLIGLKEESILLISRIQGEKNKLHSINNATRVYGDVAPPFLLVDAIRAVAKELEIRVVAGVGDEERIGVDFDSNKFSYDTFWQTYLGSAACNRFYVVGESYAGKHLQQVSPRHRRRTKRKRKLRKDVADSIGATFARDCLRKEEDGVDN